MAQNNWSSDKTIWHENLKLRQFRREKGLSQERFASVINQHFKEKLPNIYHASLCLTQSIISDLELGKTSPSLPILQIIASFLGVDMNELLKAPFRNFSSSGMILSGSDELKNSEDSKDKIFILPSFPSALFVDETGINTLSENYHHRKRYIEIYRLQGLVNFLFSPCTSFNKQHKLEILTKVIAFFSVNINRHFLLMCDLLSNNHGLNASPVFVSGIEVSFLLPFEMNGGGSPQDQYVKFKNTTLVDAVENLIIESPPELILNPLSLLEAAKEVLLVSEDTTINPVIAFYQEFVRCGHEPSLLRNLLSPEIRQYIEKK